MPKVLYRRLTLNDLFPLEGQAKHFAQDDLIAGVGKPDIFFIEQGLVRCQGGSLLGAPCTYTLLGPGYVVGFKSYWPDANEAFRAYGDVVAWEVGTLVRGNQLQWALDYSLSVLRSALQESLCDQTLKLDLRLVRTFIRLADLVGGAYEDLVKVPVRPDYGDFAQMTGASRDAVSKRFTSVCRQLHIQVAQDALTFDLKTLEAYVNSEL